MTGHPIRAARSSGRTAAGTGTAAHRGTANLTGTAAYKGTTSFTGLAAHRGTTRHTGPAYTGTTDFAGTSAAFAGTAADYTTHAAPTHSGGRPCSSLSGVGLRVGHSRGVWTTSASEWAVRSVRVWTTPVMS